MLILFLQKLLKVYNGSSKMSDRMTSAVFLLGYCIVIDHSTLGNLLDMLLTLIN